MMFSRLASATAIISLAAMIAIAPNPANAAPPSVDHVAGAHCVMNLDTGDTSCFSTFTEALAVATGGRITDAPADPSVAVADPSFDNRINTAGGTGVESHIVLAISYDGTAFTGSSLISTGSANCSPSKSFNHTNLAAVGSGWSNRISSFRSFANCRVTLYDYTNCGGAHQTWGRNQYVPGMGALDNKASSMRFTYYYPPNTSC